MSDGTKEALGIVILAAILAAFCMLVSVRAEDNRVSVAIVLAADVSCSINEPRWKLQRDGYATAVQHPSVLDAIRGTSRGSVALMLVEWSGPIGQTVIAPWTVVATPEDARRFAAQILGPPRTTCAQTAVAAAIAFAQLQFATAPPADRLVIDVSGDGAENTNGNTAAARDAAALAGITVNGIPILGEEPGIEDWYRDHVVSPGGFVIAAESFDAFAYALVGKLVREVADIPTQHAEAR